MAWWDRLRDKLKQARLDEQSEKADFEKRKAFSMSELARRAKDRIFNRKRRSESTTIQPDRIDEDDDDGEIELLGRDASYNQADWQQLTANEIRVVNSSNVYSYVYESEPAKIGVGILYVTFLYWEPGVKSEDRSGPGVTYAYFDFPQRKYEEFNKASSESAGKAVWDYCRIRGSLSGHQHRYRVIDSPGDYIPRKATEKGFKSRTVIGAGLSPNARRVAVLRQQSGSASGGRFVRKSTLPEEVFARGQSSPNRGRPNRGEPNRG